MTRLEGLISGINTDCARQNNFVSIRVVTAASSSNNRAVRVRFAPQFTLDPSVVLEIVPRSYRVLAATLTRPVLEPYQT